jgi:hypothetical protein
VGKEKFEDTASPALVNYSAMKVPLDSPKDSLKPGKGF